MTDRKTKKTTTVHEHPMHVPISRKNPTGITIRHEHKRRVYTCYTAEELKTIYQNYDLKNINFPKPVDLGRMNGNKYDQLIAVWTDFFNKRFPPTPPIANLDPNLIKALIGSESDFSINPNNHLAIGISQITPSTLKILKDPNGEIKDYLFKNIKQQDLLDPEVGIPCGIRWFFYKYEFAKKTLKREPTPEKAVLFYKGLQNSESNYKKNALNRFREMYELLKK